MYVGLWFWCGLGWVLDLCCGVGVWDGVLCGLGVWVGRMRWAFWVGVLVVLGWGVGLGLGLGRVGGFG